MPSHTLSPDARRMLDGANYAHLATLMPTGAPKVEPVWVARDEDRILVTTDAASIKARNVAVDARVALCVVAFDDPYEQLLVRGAVVDVRADDDLATLDAMAQKYLGAPFPRRRWSGRLVLVIEAATSRYHRSPLVDPRLADVVPDAPGSGQR